MRNENNFNRFIRDEAIENATTFEEARAIIVSRLNDLRCDLSDRSPVEDSIVLRYAAPGKTRSKV